MGGTKNTLFDLNDHLFMQMERLGDEMTAEELEIELKKAKAMAGMAGNIINIADLVLQATKINNDFENKGTVPRLLIGDNKND